LAAALRELAGTRWPSLAGRLRWICLVSREHCDWKAGDSRWTRQFPDAVRRLVIDDELWDYLGNEQDKTTPSYTPTRWGSAASAEPLDGDRADALKMARALYRLGERSRARLAARLDELRDADPWIRALARQLARSPPAPPLLGVERSVVMRSLRLIPLVTVGILASAALADTSVRSPGSMIELGYDGSAPDDARRFLPPTTLGVLVPGQPVSVTIDLRRFIFPAGCADSARVQSATLIVRDSNLGETVHPMALATGPSASATVTITVPDAPTLDLGFTAETEGGCVARDTHLEAFYHFAVDTQAAVLSFGAAAQQPTVSGTVTPGHALVVDYDPPRLNATYGTDAEGNAIALASCSATYMGQDTMSLGANVTFLDADGNPLTQQPNAQVVYQAGQPRTASFTVPTAARSFTIYVSAANYYDPRCGYDSNGGNNFTFPVAPSSTSGFVGGLGSR
ncbi:MAG TPA: DUF6209 family protein, partial [Planctomycetota bacterium]|nr:DUF6209 family protein [Planctomycetota bacterium]